MISLPKAGRLFYLTPFHAMIQRLLLLALTGALVGFPLSAFAQNISAKEEERLQALQSAGEQWFAPRNKTSIGFRLLNSGGKVEFKNLGSVLARTITPASEEANVNRVYDTGTVFADALRASEVDENGNQKSTPGGRYQVVQTVTVIDYDADGNQVGTHTEDVLTGDYVSFTPGLTRLWRVITPEQLQGGDYIPFTNYRTESTGGSFSDKPGATMGVELQYNRDMGRLTRRLQWGISTGVVLNSINSKTAGTVESKLFAHTDYYRLTGTLPTATYLPFETPYFDAVLDQNGNLINLEYERQLSLNVTPDESLATDQEIAGGTSVKGRWQVRGAYLLFKVGPSIQAQLTEHFSLVGSLGFAGAYAGTTYTATETFTVPGLLDLTAGTTVTNPDGSTTTTYPLLENVGDTTPELYSSTVAKFVAGYYADLTLEWAANDTTSLFGGFTAQRLGDYEQKLPYTSQLARIDLGSAVGIRGGISIRF